MCQIQYSADCYELLVRRFICSSKVFLACDCQTMPVWWIELPQADLLWIVSVLHGECQASNRVTLFLRPPGPSQSYTVYPPLRSFSPNLCPSNESEANSPFIWTPCVDTDLRSQITLIILRVPYLDLGPRRDFSHRFSKEASNGHQQSSVSGRKHDVFCLLATCQRFSLSNLNLPGF